VDVGRPAEGAEVELDAARAGLSLEDLTHHMSGGTELDA
jgi:hypothetical protein